IIKRLTFQEKSGFQVKELSTNAIVSNTFMEFEKLKLLTNNSSLGNHLKFSYKDFGDFGDFVKKVNIDSKMKNVFIDSRDIEYFAPNMKFVRFKAEVDQGDVKGTVTDIRVQNADIKTGNQTKLTGNLTIKGLPDINKTFFDFQTNLLQTTA